MGLYFNVISLSSTGKPHNKADSANCWDCQVTQSLKGKFIAKKSADPIDRRIRNLQKGFGLSVGEPLNFSNIYKIIPPLVSMHLNRKLYNI
jgi:hypothetical protein